MKNKGLISTILLVIFLVVLITGSSFAFWIWESDRGNDTNVAFTTQGKNFSCSADGGGNITSSDVLLEPTKCTDTSHAIAREINTNVINNASQPIRLDLWLNINSLASELASTANFKWALTTSNLGCEVGTIIDKGDFKFRTAGDKQIISQKIYSNSDTDTYYLYIWLDEEETNANTANKSFNLSLGGECTDSNMPNKPYINNSGLIPVKLSASGDTVTAISEDNPEWYDYYNKKWANTVLVESTNRSNYQNLTGNTEVNIPTSEILAYYVWIPRYSYKVWQYSGASAKGQEHEIDIKFVSRNIKELATQNGEWYTHPAFTFGDQELSGIWVGKFETSHAVGSSQNSLGTSTGENICNSTSCDKYIGLRVIPNVYSLRNNRISNYFYASRFMESEGNPFGLVNNKIDSHIMKNLEWGAVAYLSHSKYGINREIRINSQYKYTTGCGALYDNSGYSVACQSGYADSVTVFPQSTTGNVTGIFDISGGSEEYVMGVYKSGVASSGFSSLPDMKYYDNYPNPPFTGASGASSIFQCTFQLCGGHALNETASWYGDTVYPLNTSYYWYVRGGPHDKTSAAGAFNIDASTGGPTSKSSFRLVLVEE